ncbi:MAG: hypothetical protein R2762_09780 [Bryobacteraceae bacterium]
MRTPSLLVSAATAILLQSLPLCLPAAGESPAGLRALVRESLEGLNRESKLREDYLFAGRNESIEFNAAGKTVRRTTSAWEMVVVDGVVLRRATERNGKPLTDAETAADLESLRAQAREWKETPPEKRAQSRRDEHMVWLQEFPEALDYRLAGEESREGRATLVLQFEPRPGYKPRNLRARVFEKTRGKLWIDKAEKEVVRVEVEVFDDISIAYGLFGKIVKGTQFGLSRQRLAERAWITDWQRFRFDARVLMVKTIRRQEVNHFERFSRRSVEAARVRAE